MAPSSVAMGKFVAFLAVVSSTAKVPQVEVFIPTSQICPGLGCGWPAAGAGRGQGKAREASAGGES